MFIFYSEKGEVLKEFVESKIDNINELVIDKDFISCEHEFGNFSIFHLSYSLKIVSHYRYIYHCLIKKV